MIEDQTKPKSTSLGYTKTDEWILTHSNWNACPMLSAGSNETGVRSIKNGEAQNDFKLIQHGWFDLQMAEKVILSRLRKGWNVGRIARFMDRLNERGIFELKGEF